MNDNDNPMTTTDNFEYLPPPPKLISYKKCICKLCRNINYHSTIYHIIGRKNICFICKTELRSISTSIKKKRQRKKVFMFSSKILRQKYNFFPIYLAIRISLFV